MYLLPPFSFRLLPWLQQKFPSSPSEEPVKENGGGEECRRLDVGLEEKHPLMLRGIVRVMYWRAKGETR